MSSHSLSGGEDGFASPSPSLPDLDLAYGQAWAQGQEPDDLFGHAVPGSSPDTQPSPPPIHTGAVNRHVDEPIGAEQQAEVHPLSDDNDGDCCCIPDET